MSSASAQVVAVTPPLAFRERGLGGQTIPTPALGYPSLIHATRPLRSSPLAGPSFSGNPSITQSTTASSLDVRPYARSTPSSTASHAGSPSTSTSSFSSYAHRAPGTPSGPSRSAGSTSTLNLDSRPHSPPPSIIPHSSSSHHAHSAPRVAQVKSTGAIPTVSLFHRQAKEDPTPPPPTQPPLVHSRSITFAPNTASPPAHIPKTYNPRAPRPTTAPGPSVSRDAGDNWMSSSPFGPAATPRFSRQSMSQKPVIMPLSAREFRRQKCTSMTNSTVVYPVTSCSPVEEVQQKRVNELPHIVISNPDASHATVSSGNRPSRRVSSPPPPRPAASQPTRRSGSPEPQLSPKSSYNTFVSFTSENEAESSVIKVVDPGVMPRRRQSAPHPTQRHSRLSLVDAVNRLSVASGETEFFDTEEHTITRRISVTEDDGVLRRVSSRRKPADAFHREVALANTVAKEYLATQEYPRMVRIAETCEVSSDTLPPSRFSSKFSDSSHECQPEDGVERSASGGIPTHQNDLQSTDSKPPVPLSPELQTRPRKKLTKPRIQDVEVPFTRSGSSSSWIPETSPLKSSSPGMSQSEHVLESPETGDSRKGRKRWSSRLTFKLIPSRLKSTPSLPMRNEMQPKSSIAEPGFGTGHTVTQGSATTITLVPPPPIMCSSSVSSSAANSTSSLAGSGTTMPSRDTSATSIGSLTCLEQPYLVTSSYVKERIVVQSVGDTDSDQSEVQQENSRDGTTTPPPVTGSRYYELQEVSSLSSVSSYVSFPSTSTAAGSIPNAPDTKVSGYLHPMWTIPMVTTATPQTALPDSPTVHETPVRPTVIPAPAVASTPPTRPHTTRLRRPRPQTAPSSPKSAAFPPSPSKSPHPQKAGASSSGLKSMLRHLVGRTG